MASRYPLLLMRHAKSSWRHSGLSDHNRPLNRRGEKAAYRMAAFLHAQGIVPERILSSSATRATLTAQIMAAEFSIHEIHVQPALYLADLTVWKHLLTGLTADQATLVIGHNPGLENLVSEKAGKPVRFPTAAVAAFRLNHQRATFCMEDLSLGQLWFPREI